MKVGDTIGIGVGTYDYEKEEHVNLDDIEDIVIDVYTSQKKKATFHKQDMKRGNKYAYTINVDTSDMKEGTLLCDLYFICGKENKQVSKEKELGYLHGNI